jgi:hypothetical protein
MEIKEVSFKRVKSFGNFENVGIEAKATLANEDYPKQCVEALRVWVDERITEFLTDTEIKPLENEKEDLERQIREIREQIGFILEAVEKVRYRS